MGEVIGHTTRHTVRDVDGSVVVRQTASTVPGETESTVLTYTVAGDPLLLDLVTATGTYAAEFRLYINGTWYETQRMGIEQPVAHFTFAPHRLEVGDVVDIKVFHYDTNNNRDFESTLKGHR